MRDTEKFRTERLVARSWQIEDLPFAMELWADPTVNLHHDLMRAAPRTSTQTEVLAGLVDRVTFHNSENGFCVLRVKARGQRDLITVIGHAAMISAGEFVQAGGSWINDRTHGVQFRASFLKATAPTTVEGIEKYLGSGMIRGIGPVYAKKLVRAFGETVFDVIQQEPSLTASVIGNSCRLRDWRIAAGASRKGLGERDDEAPSDCCDRVGDVPFGSDWRCLWVGNRRE
jgi:hypothetical protein